MVFRLEETHFSIQDLGPFEATYKDASEGRKLPEEAHKEIGRE